MIILLLLVKNRESFLILLPLRHTRQLLSIHIESDIIIVALENSHKPTETKDMNHILTLFEVENANRKIDRFTFEHASNKLTAIAVASDAEVTTAVAEFFKEDSSVTKIELCGGISSAFPAKLRQQVPAIKNTPIGSVAFGFESLDSVMAYKQAYVDGEDLSQAFIYIMPGINSLRIDKIYGQTRTAIIAVPDARSLQGAAQQLYREKVHLIELYGWISNEDIASVIMHTGKGHIPVGYVGYTSVM